MPGSPRRKPSSSSLAACAITSANSANSFWNFSWRGIRPITLSLVEGHGVFQLPFQHAVAAAGRGAQKINHFVAEAFFTKQLKPAIGGGSDEQALIPERIAGKRVADDLEARLKIGHKVNFALPAVLE